MLEGAGPTPLHRHWRLAETVARLGPVVEPPLALAAELPLAPAGEPLLAQLGVQWTAQMVLL